MTNGSLPYRLQELHEKYGPIVRIASNELSFIDAAAWKDIYAQRHLIRPSEWRNRLPGKNSDHFISANVPTHLRFRKMFSPAFSDAALRKQEPLIQSYITKMLSRAGEATAKPDRSVNIVELFNFTTFDIIGDLGWGQSFKCLETMQYHPWVTVVLHFKMTIIVAALKYYPTLDRLMTAMTPASALESIRMITKTAADNVEQRLKMGQDRSDFLTYAMKHNSSNTTDPISTEEMETNSMALIVAGSDTMTTALTGIVNCLLQSPESMVRLQKEIRKAFVVESDIDSVSTNKLPFLKAVIEEGLRLCPPVPDIMRRQVSGGDVDICGHRVPDGTIVGISMLATYRSTTNFTHPNEFRPDRWMAGKESAEYMQDNKAAFQPFSVGPTGCIGHNLAKMELRLILARLMWTYNIEPAPGGRGIAWTSQKIWWSWSKEPPVRISISNAH